MALASADGCGGGASFSFFTSSSWAGAFSCSSSSSSPSSSSSSMALCDRLLEAGVFLGGFDFSFFWISCVTAGFEEGRSRRTVEDVCQGGVNNADVRC